MAQVETLHRVMVLSTDTLKLKCRGCGHETELTRADAFRRYGAGSTAYSVRRRSRCSVCKAVDLVDVWV